MKKHTFLAFDIGATSGRAVVGTLAGDEFEMRELYRFPNGILEVHGKYYWDIYELYRHLVDGMTLCTRQGVAIDSIGIDTWGVDFGYIASDGSILGLPRAYRDPYTNGAPEEFFEKFPRQELYRMTGIQIMNFNSLFQLYRARQECFTPLMHAEEILFIPDLLSYMLTGNRVCEYTDASTSQLLNPVTKQFEPALLEQAGVSPTILRRPVMPGTPVGYLTDTLASKTGLGRVPVIAVAGHDTASAVAAVPSADRHFAYLSSGTWSLMGIEVAEPIITDESYRHNFTNEGGIEGTTRFLKNITGMWLLERCRGEWEREGRAYSYQQIVEMAHSGSGFCSTINPDDDCFANPTDMRRAIHDFCVNSGQPAPTDDAHYVYCIFNSLASRYKEVLTMLSSMAPFPIEKLHVIGGGSQNKLLNQFTANAIAIPVVAGPSEATAIGNCMVQAKAAGLVADRWQMREIVARSFPLETYYPEN
jgi:rhamnulokinase